MKLCSTLLCAIALWIAFAVNADAQRIGPVPVAGGITSLPVQPNQGGTGATSLGNCLTNSGSALNFTQPISAQIGTSYTILAGNGCDIITFSNTGIQPVTLPQAGTSGFSAGYSFYAQNKGSGVVFITPTTSTIGGNAILPLAQNQGCQITADAGNNYQLSNCGSLSGTNALQAQGAAPRWYPIGGRIYGIPGSGSWDSTHNSDQDSTCYLTPLNYPVKSIRLCYAGFNIADQGEVDMLNSFSGFASIYDPLPTFTQTTSASSAAGLFTLTFTPNLNGQTAPQVGMAVSGTNIPASTYVTAVTSGFTSSALTSLVVTVNNAFTSTGITNGETITFTGKIYPATWGNGTQQFSVQPVHDFICSNPINVNFAANYQYCVHNSALFSQLGYLLNSSISGSLITGETSTRGTNQTTNYLSPLVGGNSGGGHIAPAIILGDLAGVTAPVPSVLVGPGDSICAGAHDQANATTGWAGYINTLLGNTTPFGFVCRGSTTAQDCASSNAGQVAAAELIGATDVLLEDARNDIEANGTSAANTKTYVAACAAPFISQGMKVWVSTVPPTTTGNTTIQQTPTINTAGSGYGVSGTCTANVTGGTGTVGTVTFTTTAGGIPNTITSFTAGNYSVNPSVYNVATNTPTGTGCTGGLNLTLNIVLGLGVYTTQTIASSAHETQRLLYNADVLANYASYGYAGVIDTTTILENQAHPGYWVAGYSDDGVHPNAIGNAALVTAKILPTTQFGQ